jgi:hypothetical protein
MPSAPAQEEPSSRLRFCAPPCAHYLPTSGADRKAEPPRCVREGGMSLHADVATHSHDRKRLERLARYILRPPVALDRLEAQPDGRLSYKLKTQWRDGTTHILMERHELLERLAPLIPPPRAHQVRYFGLCSAEHKPFYAEHWIMRSSTRRVA